MRAQRIKTVFHRIGLTLAVICGVLGVLMMGLGAYYYFEIAMAAGVAAWILAAAGYVVARALGWIIARIFGDSN